MLNINNNCGIISLIHLVEERHYFIFVEFELRGSPRFICFLSLIHEQHSKFVSS